MYATPLFGENDGFSQWLYKEAEISNSSPNRTLLRQGSGDRCSSSRRTAIYDRLYGQMLFPPVFDIFIDSPQVQRLRDLKQLGNAHYIYPGATNTRFEHSLGTAHLAMEFLKQIYANHQEEPDYIQPAAEDATQPMPSAFLRAAQEDPVYAMLTREYDSAVKDLWCVGIAGLCHDLGHGPLSHMFEAYVNQIRVAEEKQRWHHEQASMFMVDAIWEANRDLLERSFQMTAQDLAFIKLCIEGIKPGDPWDEDTCGRPAWKRFMAEIVANKRNGLDVDKLDYLRRDYMCCCGLSSLPSMSRLFQGARAMADATGQYQIAYQEKLHGSIDAVFNERAHLHRIIYQHRVTRVVDAMIIDAFAAANNHFVLHDADGHAYRLSDCVDHPDVYVKTGDWIVKAMLNHPAPEMRRAREILERIESRRIYTSVRAFDAPRQPANITEPTSAPAPHTPRRGSRDDKATRASSDSDEKAESEIGKNKMPRASSARCCTPVRLTPMPVRVRKGDYISESELYSYLLDRAELPASLCTRMELWTKQNEDLRAVTLIRAKISKVASEMNATEEPVTRVGFFQHRRIGAHRPGSPLSECRLTDRTFEPLTPEVRYVVVSRMPLLPEDVEVLSKALEPLLTEEQKHSTLSFSGTPKRSARSPALVPPVPSTLVELVPQLTGVDAVYPATVGTHSAGGVQTLLRRASQDSQATRSVPEGGAEKGEEQQAIADETPMSRALTPCVGTNKHAGGAAAPASVVVVHDDSARDEANAVRSTSRVTNAHTDRKRARNN